MWEIDLPFRSRSQTKRAMPRCSRNKEAMYSLTLYSVMANQCCGYLWRQCSSQPHGNGMGKRGGRKHARISSCSYWNSTRNMFNIVLSTEKLGGTEAPCQKSISEGNPNTSKPHLTSFLQRVFPPHREKFDNSIHKNVRMLRAWRMAWTLFEVPPLTEQARTWLRF